MFVTISKICFDYVGGNMSFIRTLPGSGDVYLVAFFIVIVLLGLASVTYLTLALTKAEPPKPKGRT